MAESFNPFAPPKTSLEPSSPEGYWAEGKHLVMYPNATLPPRCIKCNEPAELPMKKRSFYWHHPAYYLLLLVNILVFAIVALAVRKQAKIAPGLCTKHRQRRFRNLALSWLAFISGIILMICAGAYDIGFLFLPGLILVPVGLIASIILSPLLTPVRIDATRFRFKGCGRAFLESLPNRQD